MHFLGLERSSRLEFAPWRKLIAYMREWEADVLHAHKFGSNVWGSLIAPRAHVPVFVAHEQTWSYKGKLHRKLLDRHLIARRADAFIAVSNEDRRRMVEVERIPAAKVRYIPNGVPDSSLAASGRDVRDELGIAPGRPVIGVVAIPRPQKALDVLIRAAVLLRKEFPSIAVLMVGGSNTEETAEERRLRSLISELGLANTVSMLGARADVPDLVNVFDVAVLCSDYEGTPLAVMEYMAAGKPVVATRVGGVPDLIEDGVNGLLVQPRDPEALATAIVSLLRNPHRAISMGESGRERRRTEFSIEATTRKVEALYEELHARRVERY